MKTKNLIFGIASILSLLIAVSLVSAALTFSNPSLDKDSGNHVTSLNVTNTGSEAVTFNVTITPLTLSEGSSDIVFTAISGSQTIAANEQVSLPISYNVDSGFEFLLGKKYSVNVVLINNSTGSTISQKTLSFESSDFCSVSNNGELDISISDINVIEGFAEDDEEWYPLDQVEVEVDIENNGNEDIENINIEWALYTQDGEKVLDGDAEDIDLDEGDDDTISFTIDVDPKDLDSGTEDYVLYVSATGEITDGTFEGDDSCSSDSQSVKVLLDNDFVVVDKEGLDIPTTMQCGVPTTISGDVWNIGSKDQDDVYILFYSSQLDLDQRLEIGDIDSLDSESFSFELTLPKNVESKTYSIEIEVYDEDEDIFENDNDDESRVVIPITVDCGAVDSSSISFDAELESGGESGKETVVKTTITNDGDKLIALTFNTRDYQEWANSATLSQGTLALNPGESGDVLITLENKDNISGEKMFNLDISSQGKVIATQPIEITIKESNGLSLGNIFNSDNWYLWVVGLFNIILIIIIIVVALRVARK